MKRSIFNAFLAIVSPFLRIVGLSTAQSLNAVGDEVFLGTLSTVAHQVSGDVYLLSEKVLEIRGFTYNGTSPSTYFWADTNPTPSSGGRVISDGSPSSGCAVSVADPALPRLTSATQRVEFPEGFTIQDFLGGSLSVWCEGFSVNFGSIRIPETLDERNIPQGGPTLECSANAAGIVDTPVAAAAVPGIARALAAADMDLDEFTTVTLEGQIADSFFAFKFNPSDPRADGQDTISIVFEVPVNAWAGWAVSDNGGFMPGSEAVIGVPETGEVLKYNLIDRTLNGPVPMPEEQQTLIDANVSQGNGKTTLVFTKILVEDGEIPIDVTGDNVFLSAWGLGNSLGAHAARSAYLLSGQGLEARKQRLWKAHGWFAAIAWALLSPLAIASSVFRQFFPREGMWFQFHRGLNMMVLLFTLAAFVIAVVAIQQEAPEGTEARHFDRSVSKGHPLIGIIIFILAFGQALGGIFRPNLRHKLEPIDDEDGKPEVAPEPKSTARFGWEIAHRVLGVGILGICWYQVLLGIKSYANIFADGDAGAALPAFWAIVATLGAMIMAGYVLKFAYPPI